jgi:hypothetical protein
MLWIKRTALDTEILALGTVDELLGNLLESLDLAGGQGDADLVSLGRLAELLVLGVVRHVELLLVLDGWLW